MRDDYYKLTHPEWYQSSPGYNLWRQLLNEIQPKSSGYILEVGNQLLQAQGVDPMPKVGAMLQWAWWQWHSSNRPIFRLVEGLSSALLHTELPEKLEVLPRLPFSGFFLSIPDLFKVWNKDTGLHSLEGIYVFSDYVRPYDSAPTPLESIGFIVVGEDLNKHNVSKKEFKRRRAMGIADDALQYTHVLPNVPFLRENEKHLKGIKEAVYLALNLLLVFNSTEALSLKEVVPIPPKSPKKVKRLASRGKSTHKYFSLSLTRTHTKNADALTDWNGPTYTTVVSGHYRRVWLLSPPESAQILETKEQKGSTLHCVRKFIAPYESTRRGEKPKKNIYSVRR